MHINAECLTHIKRSLSLAFIIWAILLGSLFWGLAEPFLYPSSCFLRGRKAWVLSLLVVGQRHIRIWKGDSRLWTGTRGLGEVRVCGVSVGLSLRTGEEHPESCGNSKLWQCPCSPSFPTGVSVQDSWWAFPLDQPDQSRA